MTNVDQKTEFFQSTAEFIKAFKGPVTDINGLRALLRKHYYNAYPVSNKNGMIQYRHPDLYTFAKAAYERGETAFYADPVDPNNPNGKQKLSEPRYKYKLARELTEEEYQAVFGNQ